MAGPRTTDIDQPITRIEDDAFDFVPRYAVPLARRIAETPDSASLTIGIYGPWGSGKTSLMNLIQAELTAKPDKAPVIVSYTAWKFAQEQSLWRTLVRVILDELLKQSKPDDAELRSLREALYRDVVKTQRKVRVDPVRLAGAITSAVTLGASSWLQAEHVSVPVATQVTLAGVALGGAGVTAFGMKLVGKSGGDAKKPDLAEQLGGQAKELIQAVEVVDDVLTTHYKAEHIEQFADSFQLVVDKFLNGRKLVIFIDDLDRCLPEKAIQVLEGIKLFLGVPGTVFVLGVDVAALVHAVEVHYAGTVPSAMNGGRYLEKIVQFPFHLPSMRSDEVTTKRLIDQLCSTPDDRDWLRIGVDGFAANPRAVKRFALLYRSRLEVMGGPANLHLAKLVVLQEHPQWRDLVETVLEYTVSTPRSLLRDGPLALLERASRDATARDSLLASDGGLMGKLAVLARDDGLMRFLSTAPFFDEEGVDPIDPLPLLRLSGAAPGSSVPTSLSLDDIVEGLLLPDAPIRATAVAAARQQPATSRQQLVERLLIEVAGRSQNPNPDEAGLPEYVDAVRICFEQQIERDQIADRLDWFTALADHGLNREVATRSRQQLIQLTLDINTAPQSVPFVADDPTSSDLLDMNSHAQALVRTILQTPPPLTVGILGEWGSGKSFFLRMLGEIFTDEEGIRLAEVNAWATSESDPISFTQSAFTDLLEEDTLGPAATSANQLREQLADATATVPDDERRLVLLVDDLDRCVPSFVVDLLLTLNTVAPKSLVLIVAVDPRWLSRAFEERFGREEGQATIQRLITLPFSMPSVPATTLLTAELADNLGTLTPYIATTPREMKRFVNLLELCLERASSRGDAVDQRQLAVVLTIALRWPTLMTNVDAFVQLWYLTNADPVSQDEAARQVTDDLELLDSASLISLLEKEPPPARHDVTQLVDLVREVIPDER
ncbi:hypothetical protein GCM10009745_76160 [Kribbella yunnanensis]|uniref:AAA+ ATPase domain-containing protein n=1 Tax=Kribbella yunnanensis TaxID=190194 RepID=A0ABN2J273_9ACTN